MAYAHALKRYYILLTNVFGHKLLAPTLRVGRAGWFWRFFELRLRPILFRNEYPHNIERKKNKKNYCRYNTCRTAVKSLNVSMDGSRVCYGHEEEATRHHATHRLDLGQRYAWILTVRSTLEPPTKMGKPRKHSLPGNLSEGKQSRTLTLHAYRLHTQCMVAVCSYEYCIPTRQYQAHTYLYFTCKTKVVLCYE